VDDICSFFRLFVGTVDDGSGGDLIELVILCECGRFDDDFVLAVVLVVLSRLASVSAFTFCFIASVGSTYHLGNHFIEKNFERTNIFKPFSFVFLREKFFKTFCIFRIR
jgi:hypothetical protein